MNDGAKGHSVSLYLDEDRYEGTVGRSLPDFKYLEYEAPPPWTLYPIKSRPCLPEGWEWWVDSLNAVFYIDTCPGQNRIGKRCFWEPPIPEKSPGRIPPPGWIRIESTTGRIAWLHTKSGLKSYEYPLDNNFILFQDGELARVQVKGFDAPQAIAHLTKEQLVLRDDHIACQISPTVWRNGLSKEVQSYWLPDVFVYKGDWLLETRLRWIEQKSEPVNKRELWHTLRACGKKQQRSVGSNMLEKRYCWRLAVSDPECREQHIALEALVAHDISWHSFSVDVSSEKIVT